MAWRVARSLDKLLEQINARYPNRNKASDGSIGDAAHASRTSDHNPWVKDGAMGVVTARDFTHDPAHGVDIDRLTDELAASRDPRIKYIIANGWILDSRSGNNPWRWVRYTGSNPHTKHFHLSVMPSKHLYDDTRPWNLPSLTGGGGAAAPAGPPAPSPGGTTLSKAVVLDALREYFNTPWHEPRQAGDQPDISLKGGLLDTHRFVVELKGQMAALDAKVNQAVDELTRARPARGNPQYKATVGEYAVNADHYSYQATQQLADVVRALADLRALVEQIGSRDA